MAIVILCWNNKQLTLDCLESLQALDYPAWTAIVVDNGSHDGTVMAVSEHHPASVVIETGTNLGYAGGNNVGVRHAMDQGADFVLVLNNDTLVPPGMLSALVATAQERPRVGMVGPTVVFAEPRNTVFAAGSFIDWCGGRTWHRGTNEPLDGLGGPLTQEVDFLTGCGVLVRREVVEATGLLDEGYYLNYEDVDWCLRSSRAGFPVVHCASANLVHRVSSTLGLASPANTYYMTRNSLRFFWRNGPSGLRLQAVVRIAARTARTVMSWSVGSRYRQEGYRYRRAANMLAVRDFLAGRFGPMGPDVSRACGVG